MLVIFSLSFIIFSLVMYMMHQALIEWESNFNQKRVFRSSKYSPSYRPFYLPRKHGNQNNNEALASLNMDHVHVFFKSVSSCCSLLCVHFLIIHIFKYFAYLVNCVNTVRLVLSASLAIPLLHLCERANDIQAPQIAS